MRERQLANCRTGVCDARAASRMRTKCTGPKSQRVAAGASGQPQSADEHTRATGKRRMRGTRYHFTEMCCGTEAGSYLRLIDSCITQLKAQGPSRTCTESQEEEEEGPARVEQPSRGAAPFLLRLLLLGQPSTLHPKP